MIGVVMAGGRGSRMKANTEKLLLLYQRPVVARVLDALCNSGLIGEVLAVTSPLAPRTAKFLRDAGIRTVETEGAGYSLDLGRALEDLSGTVLVVPGDLPLLDGEVIRRIVSRRRSKPDLLSFMVTRDFSLSLGITTGFERECMGRICRHTGISIINADRLHPPAMAREQYEIMDDKRIAFNLNTRHEYYMLRRRRP